MMLTKNFENEKVLVALSVISSFDLYFQVRGVRMIEQARKYPPGSEVIMTGINIPDMVQIIKEHGLVPVPIDYDLETMNPKSFDDVKAAITDKV